MANRDVTVRLKAEIGQYEAAMKRASSATKEVSTSGQGAFGKLAQMQREHEQAWNTLANTAMVAGGSMVATVGAITKAAISWESAWAGVKKTTDGTPEQMAALEAELRGLARTLPATHEEIAAVGEAAGQLGIKRENIAAFTKTMIDMGESTNLSADDAATSIARFTNIMGSMAKHGEDSYSRIGSAMVALGNNFATTESEINEMSLRLAGASNQIGLTEGDVLGLAAAMSSVGINAEAGGTSMSKVMKKIDSAVREGGESLEEFAKVAGVSAKEFYRMWSESPAQAIEAFTQGLGRITEAGGSAADALTDLGIKGSYEQDTMLRLAGAAEILGDAFEVGNEAFKENSALAEEASQRYETAESRIKIAWNNIKDSAITAGGAILPVVADMADAVAGFADFIGALPEPVLHATAAIVGIGGAVLLGAGIFMKGVAAITAFNAATTALGGGLPRATGKVRALSAAGSHFIGTFGKMAGVGAIALTTVGAIGKAAEQSSVGVEKLTNAAADSTNAVANIDEQFRNAEWANGNGNWFNGTVNGINGVSDAVLNLQNLNWAETAGTWMADTLGFKDATGKAKEEIGNLDAVLANLSLEDATSHFKKFASEVEQGGGSIEEMKKLFPQLEQKVLDYANSLGVTLTEQEALQAMMGDFPPKLQEAEKAAEGASGGLGELEGSLADTAEQAEAARLPLDELVDAFRVLGNIHMSETEAMGNYNEKLVEMQNNLALTGAGLDATGTRFDTHTEAGRKANAMLSENVDAMWKLTEAQARNGASQETLQGTMAGTYNSMIASMEAMGLTTEQADILTRAVLGVPEGVSIDSWMSDKAYQMANDTDTAVDGIDKNPNINITATDNASSVINGVNQNFEHLKGKSPLRLDIQTTETRTVRTAMGDIPGKYTGGFASPSRGFFAGGMPGAFDSLRRFASGGLLPGVPPASPTMDNLAGYVVDTGEPVLLRSREYIVNEPSTWRGENLSWLRWMNSGGTMPTPAPRGFAVGGSPAALPAPAGVGGATETAPIHAAIESGVDSALSRWQVRVEENDRGFKARVDRVQKMR